MGPFAIIHNTILCPTMHSLAYWYFLLSTIILRTAASPTPNNTSFERRAGGTYVSSLSQCPPLRTRSSPPSNVHELRPDDFAYTMAIGDSITAGTFLRGLQNTIFEDITEWRGQSYAAGMDEGAITIPNLIKHYNPFVTGGSKGSNLIGPLELCLGPLCIPGSIGWHSDIDQLNAARSGAAALNLPHEMNDYLIPEVNRRNVPREKFKYINLQIGSNELCYSCTQGSLGIGSASAQNFEDNVIQTLELIRSSIPNSLVNVIGVFRVSPMFDLTANEAYCTQRFPSLPHFNLECPCALLGGDVGKRTRNRMDDLTSQYNDRLVKIVKKYQELKYPDFAVIWQPPIVTLDRYPIEALSPVDCHHPSLKTHELFATGIWNRLVGTKEEKAVPVAWTASPLIRCLEEGDRILTNTLL